MTASIFNTERAEWGKFHNCLVADQASTKIRIDELLALNTEYGMDQAAICLQEAIFKAAEQAIPKRKPLQKSKKQWTRELNRLRKEMLYTKRDQNRTRAAVYLEAFKEARNTYFSIIRKVKVESQLGFLIKTTGKEVFQVYRYINPRRTEKLPPIQSENSLAVDFNDKCQAFIKVIYSKPPESDDHEQPESNEVDARQKPWFEITD